MTRKNRTRLGLQYSRLLEENRFLLMKILKRFALSATDIEDVSQEALLRAVEASEKKDVQHPKQFLISIARNVAREEVRRRSRILSQFTEDNGAENHSLDTLAKDEPDAISVLDGRQKLQLFAEAVGELPPQCRRVFVMKYVEGAAHKEISARYNISVSTVEKHVAAGLKACRSRMLESLRNASDDRPVHYLFEEHRNKPGSK